VAAERYHARQEQLRRHLESEHLDALLVTAPVNLEYLTGFTGSAGLMLVGSGVSLLITDFRYASHINRCDASGPITNFDHMITSRKTSKYVIVCPRRGHSIDAILQWWRPTGCDDLNNTIICTAGRRRNNCVINCRTTGTDQLDHLTYNTIICVPDLDVVGSGGEIIEEICPNEGSIDRI
jgi:hypothetical protein